MAEYDVVAHNPSTSPDTLEVPGGVDTYRMGRDLTVDGDIVVNGVLNGRNIAVDGAKLDHLTVTQAVDLDTMETDVAASKVITDFLTVTGAVNLDTINTQVGYLTVTGAVDLDTINTRVAALDAAVVLQGVWDASVGTFPGGGTAQAGDSWIVSVAGTVGGVVFNINDRVLAITDNADPGIYANNWLILDYTDQVLSVAGKTGAVTLEEADITDLQSYLLPTSIDSLAKLNAIVGETLIITTDSRLSDARTPTAHTHLSSDITDIADFLKADGTVGLSANWDAGAFQIQADFFQVDNYVDFIPGASPSHTEGRVFYDSAMKALSYYTDKTDVTMNLGQENWVRVRNDTGVQIDDGTPVYISGASGGIPQITKIIADGEYCIGVTTMDIPDGEIGFVTTHGTVNGLDMSAFNVGDTLWVSTTVAGDLVNTQPQWPSKALKVGTVLSNSATVGVLLIELDNHANPDVLNKSYNFSARTAASGTYYLAGFYDAPAADANLTQASPTQTLGSANHPYAAHAFMVFGAGSTDGINITITVTGTSITDAGVRTPADSEVLYNGIVAGLSVNDYLETTKKWLGQVTYTLTSDGTVFTCDFNYGWAKYEDFHNFDFTLRAFEFVGLADATDAGFNMQIVHHKSTGWTYSAAAFTPGAAAIHDMNVEYGTEEDLAAGEHFAWKESAVNQSVLGSGSEGLVIRVTTSVNNSIAYLNGHLTVTVDD